MGELGNSFLILHLQTDGYNRNGGALLKARPPYTAVIGGQAMQVKSTSQLIYAPITNQKLLQAIHEVRGMHKVLWMINAIASRTFECILWPFTLTPGGYGTCIFRRKRVLAHRLAFYLMVGDWPMPLGRHTCDTPACINPDHIIEGTDADNVADMIERGRLLRGESHGNSKLNEEQVKQIRAEYKGRSRSPNGQCGRYSMIGIAKHYNISQSEVRMILRYRRWKHI
jgi:hypothetical protein